MNKLVAFFTRFFSMFGAMIFLMFVTSKITDVGQYEVNFWERLLKGTIFTSFFYSIFMPYGLGIIKKKLSKK